MKKVLIITSLVCIYASCTQSQLEEREYIEWVENEQNGLKQKKNIGEMEFSVQYLPGEYLALVELKGKNINKNQIDSIKQNKEGVQFFTMRYNLTNSKEDILRYNLANRDEYFDRSNYFSFGLEKDVKLVEDKDTLPCVLFAFERTYGVAPFADFSFAFEEKSQDIKSKVLLVDEKVFNNGLLHFEFNADKIKNIPSLKIN